MKKIFTLFSVFTTVFAFAGTPTIDGSYNSNEGWGAPVATGDAVVGWSDANAKKLYVTYDNNYVYFAAECSAQSWEQFIFAVNTQPGGNNTDPWGRTITYNQANQPDFLFRGDIAGGNYAEYHVWNGSAWTGKGTNINSGGTEVKGSFSASAPYDGFLEIRVPRSTIGWGTKCDVEFIITGNNGGTASGHGCFDAIPNETNCSSWSSPGNASTVTNYATNITMPVALNYFKGAVNNGLANLNWYSSTEANFSNYEVEQSFDSKNWKSIAIVSSKGNNSLYSTQSAIKQNTFYRLKLVDKDGSFVYSNIVLLKKSSKQSVELINNPVKDIVKLNINSATASNYMIDVYTVDGKKVCSKNYTHPGNGVTTISFDAPVLSGLYYISIKEEGKLLQTLKLQVD